MKNSIIIFIRRNWLSLVLWLLNIISIVFILQIVFDIFPLFPVNTRTAAKTKITNTAHIAIMLFFFIQSHSFVKFRFVA